MSYDPNNKPVISNEGVNYFYYASKDNFGNTQATVSRIIKIDKTNPVVNAGGNQNESMIFTQTAVVSDLGSGIDNATYQWSEISGPGTITFGSVNALSTNISANVDGTYVIKFAVSDKMGNSSSDNFTLSWYSPRRISSGGFYLPIAKKPIVSTTVIYKFNRDLKVGMNGEDVKQLQIFLNKNGFPTALTGPGSLGHETTSFGALTKKALIKFQEANAKIILKTQKLRHGTGLFYTITRALVNKMLSM